MCSLQGENSLRSPCQSRLTAGPSTAWSSASRTTTSLRMTEGKRIGDPGERAEDWERSRFCHYASGAEGRVEMDGAKTRTSGGKVLSASRTAPLKPKAGLRQAQGKL